MSASLNRVQLIGNCTRDVEMRYTAGGTPVCELGIAVNEHSKDASGNVRESVVFVDVTCWGRTAEIAGEYLRKGSHVLIEGRLKLDKWQDKETGGNRQKLGVVCERLQFLDRRSCSAEPQQNTPATQEFIEQSSEVPF